MTSTDEAPGKTAGPSESWPGIEKLSGVQDILNKNRLLITQVIHASEEHSPYMLPVARLPHHAACMGGGMRHAPTWRVATEVLACDDE